MNIRPLDSTMRRFRDQAQARSKRMEGVLRDQYTPGDSIDVWSHPGIELARLQGTSVLLTGTAVKPSVTYTPREFVVPGGMIEPHGNLRVSGWYSAPQRTSSQPSRLVTGSVAGRPRWSEANDLHRRVVIPDPKKRAAYDEYYRTSTAVPIVAHNNGHPHGFVSGLAFGQQK